MTEQLAQFSFSLAIHLDRETNLFSFLNFPFFAPPFVSSFDGNACFHEGLHGPSPYANRYSLHHFPENASPRLCSPLAVEACIEIVRGSGRSSTFRRIVALIFYFSLIAGVIGPELCLTR
jgi:hypothetical protein